MFADQLATYLKTVMTIPSGVAVTVGYLNAEAELGIMLMNPLDGFRLVAPQEIPNYYKGPFQIIVRHTDPTAGYSLAEDVMDTLTVTDATLDSFTIKMMQAKTLPILFPKNEAGLYELSINFDVVFTRDVPAYT